MGLQFSLFGFGITQATESMERSIFLDRSIDLAVQQWFQSQFRDLKDWFLAVE